ncbi:MAG: hypothetical protein WCP85_04360 [Mariniphaga sp.]
MRTIREKDLHLIEISLEVILVLFFFSACQDSSIIKPVLGDPMGQIIYDTFLVNRDSTDSWGDECLAKFNRQKLINTVFENVYNGKLAPYDYFSGEKIASEQIRKMEKDGVFSRKEISKIQFDERWVWDESAIQMRKEVISMTIAYEVYNDLGISRGQKPIFKLVFNK